MSSSFSNKKFELFGDYVLLKNLASGGMAEVFLARPAKPEANGRILVVKRILREIANDPVFIKMFRSEINTILGFNHPHTIQLHDSGEIEGQPYIAMEYIEGKSLREITTKFTEKGEPIPVPTVLGLVAQAAAGLNYAHGFENVATGEVVNAVHRDISPHNLIVTYSGNLKVIDFGIAKAKNGIAEKTRAGQIKGKCGYLSPEQLAEDNLDGRSDIFSLGIVAWELLTSQKLFQKVGDTELQIIKRIEKCEDHIVPPSTLNPEVSPEVDAVIMKALQKNAADRYPSAAAFQAALRGVMQRQHPHYTYGDTAQIMHALFESDMALERLELRELNDTAQKVLAAQWEAKTQIVEKEKPGLLASLFRGFRGKNELPDLVELRVSKLETMLTQKAGYKHMALFVFYLVSIVGIKLDERYSLLDRFFLPAQADMFTENGSTPAPQYQQPHRMAQTEPTETVEAVETTEAETEQPALVAAPRYEAPRVLPKRMTRKTASLKPLAPKTQTSAPRRTIATSTAKSHSVVSKKALPEKTAPKVASKIAPKKTIQAKATLTSKKTVNSPSRSISKVKKSTVTH